MVASIPNDIFQFSTHAALTAGYTKGQPQTANLTSHGTHGLGVYEDGSLMVLREGKAYAVSGKGDAHPAPMQARLPFAMVTIYQPTHAVDVPSLTLDGLEELVASPQLGDARGVNSLVPFELVGRFVAVEVAGGRRLEASAGSVFGFVVPKWMEGIAGPRVHAHFLDEAGRCGGRVVGFEMGGEGRLSFAKCGRFHLGFPQGGGWEDVRL